MSFQIFLNSSLILNLLSTLATEFTKYEAAKFRPKNS